MASAHALFAADSICEALEEVALGVYCGVAPGAMGMEPGGGVPVAARWAAVAAVVVSLMHEAKVETEPPWLGFVEGLRKMQGRLVVSYSTNTFCGFWCC